MAALATARSNTHLARFHQRLRNAGKPPKVALIAVLRRLVVFAGADRETTLGIVRVRAVTELL